MNGITKMSIKRPVTIIMCSLVVVLLGIVSYLNLTTDLYPEMELPYAIVITVAPGSSPETVDSMITEKIETQMSTISGIKNVNSTSSENMSIVFLEFEDGTDIDVKMIDVDSALSVAKNSLPESAGDSFVMKISPDMMPIMNLVVKADNLNSYELAELAENKVVPALKASMGVSNVQLNSPISSTIEFELIPEAVNMLAGYGVTVDSTFLQQLIDAQNTSSSVGYVYDAEGKSYLVRVGDSINNIDELKALPILVTPQSTITLADVANITLLPNTDVYSKVNGDAALTIAVSKQNSYATSDVSKNVLKSIETFNKENEGVAEILVVSDSADFITDSINGVLNNLLLGALFSVVVLFLFLRRIKPTIIIGIAIPLSVIATFALIYFSGITLNIISLGGLALGIGMLVDNAIVVIENIYRLREEGVEKKEAAIRGTKEVTGSIIASTLTTICVFLPVIFLTGFIANMLYELALVIIFSLSSSLLVALTLVPMMASYMFTDVTKKEEKDGKIITGYRKLLNGALNHRWAVILSTIVIAGFSVFGLFNMGFEFLPETYGDELTVTIEYADTDTFEDKKAILDSFYDGIKDIDTIEYVSINMSKTANMLASDSISIKLNTTNTDEAIETKEEIEKAATSNNIVAHVSFASDMMSSGGGMSVSDISLEVSGADLDILTDITLELTSRLEAIEGATEINNGLSKSDESVTITVDRNMITSGITNQLVLYTLYSKINPSDTITTVVFDDKEYTLELKTVHDEITRENLDSTTIAGKTLGNVSTIEDRDLVTSVNRLNGIKNITISANVADGYILGDVSKDVNKVIEDMNKDLPAGYEIKTAGLSQQMSESFSALGMALLFAIILIYMVMAAQFESFKYPFIVMFTLPLAFAGAFLGLFITGTPISATVLIGLIILMGIVVNNGIVLVDYINQQVDKYDTLNDAIINGASNRVRPIFMTATTTILGLLPLAFGFGANGEMMAPMAICTISGLLCSTVLTLIVVPCIYSLMNNKKKVKAK